MELDLEFQTQVLLGLYEIELYRCFKSLSQRIKTGVDIGAAEGIFTLFYLAGTSAQKVLAFEPDEEARNRLIRNLSLNGFSDDCRLTLSDKPIRRKKDETASSLDEILCSVSSPCLVKVDVDGGETEVLQGASNVLRTLRPFWIIETHSLELEQECVRILLSGGYKVTIIPQGWYRAILPPGRPIEHNQWLVAVPEEIA